MEMSLHPASLAALCRNLETALPLATREIMTEFDLLAGHPWEHHASSPVTTYYACLYALALSVKPRRVLEIGTGFGLSSAALLKACEQLEIFVSLDLGIFSQEYGFGENNLAFARQKALAWCSRQGVPADRVKFLQANTQPPGKSDNLNAACQAPHWREIDELTQLLTPGSFDVIFVDGKHTEDGLLNDMRTFWPYLRPGGLLLCDDLHDDTYRGVFPWAGDTLKSFQDFFSGYAADIADTHIWNFPRVLPDSREGLRPFGVIRKKPAEAAPTRVAMEASAPGPAPDFAGLIHCLARAQRRLYYRDQSPATLANLVRLAEKHRPTRIVELGTMSGLSLRAWLAADLPANLTAVDLSFAALKESRRAAPLDLSRVTLLQEDIRRLDFQGLRGPDNRVLLYVDAHDSPGVPLMEHILHQALPRLPEGSLVVVDDLWYSPDTLAVAGAEGFFAARVLNDIDPLQCFTGHYAPYWRGGSFMGFAETVPFLAWVNRNRVALEFDREHKGAWFTWPPPAAAEERAWDDRNFQEFLGHIRYHPFAACALKVRESLSLDGPTLAALPEFLRAGDLYAQGRVDEALACLIRANDLPHRLSGLDYAQAVCLARLGKMAEAKEILAQELKRDFPHSRAGALGRDLDAWLEEEASAPVTAAQADPGFTLFACPKAFEGHTGVIQRNAILSWTRLDPKPEIILFGNDPGAAEFARELGLRHLPEVKQSEAGTPLVSDLFHRAQEAASHETLAYVNADIILLQDFVEAIREVGSRFPAFLMVGQRWDLEVREPLEVEKDGWQQELRRRVDLNGVLHAVSALDYFAFSRGLWPEIPPFALGRTVWDNWLTAHPLLAGHPVIDATPAVLAIHQNHDYRHVPGGATEAWKGQEARRNQELGWASLFLCYVSHATWELTDSGLEKRPREQRAFDLAREGQALLLTGKLEEALARFDEISTLLPNGLPGLLHARARALQGLGRREEARAALQAELAAHPSHLPAERLLANLEGAARRRRRLPRLSVVIPAHNRARYLEEAIASAFAQEYQDMEVLVVDDGSTDDTPQVVSRFQDPRLRYLTKEKTGAPDTRNRGIAEARGRWILWLDSDDVLLPG